MSTHRLRGSVKDIHITWRPPPSPESTQGLWGSVKDMLLTWRCFPRVYTQIARFCKAYATNLTLLLPCLHTELVTHLAYRTPATVQPRPYIEVIYKQALQNRTKMRKVAIRNSLLNSAYSHRRNAGKCTLDIDITCQALRWIVKKRCGLLKIYRAPWVPLQTKKEDQSVNYSFRK